MAKQRRALPTRRPRDRSRDDDSLLLRSAESLGRVIGALQRQLDGATRRLAGSGGNGLAQRRRARAATKGVATKRKRSTGTKTKAKSIKKR